MSTIPSDDSRFSRVRRAFLAIFAAALVLPLMASANSVSAEKKGSPPQQSGPTQIALTPKHVEQYIAAFKEVAPLIDKLDEAGDKPDPQLLTAVEAAVKKYGFANLDEYDSIAISISAVLYGVDPKTKEFSDPIASIKQEIADIQKDKSMSAADRKKAIQDLNNELKEVQPVQHKGNIQMVLKYYDQLAALTEQSK